MKNLALKQKLILLCAFFIIITAVVGLFGIRQVNLLSTHLKIISDIQLPIVKRITMIDMFHEGMDSIVQKSVLAEEHKDDVAMKEIKVEHTHAQNEINLLLSEIDKLEMSPKIKNLLSEVRPILLSYIQCAGEVVELASNHKQEELSKKIEEFEKLFSILEVKLKDLGDQVENDSKAEKIEAAKVENFAKTVSSLLLSLAIVIGVISSWLIVTSLVREIGSTVETLSSSAHDIQNTSMKMNGLSKKLSITVETQASSLTESVTAMDEIAAMIKNNEHSATTAANLSQKTKESAESGKVTVDKMLGEMKDISQSYDDIQNSVIQNSEDILKIIDVISSISTKTEVINEIVFQTKLLSFNASVEAARAGEAGKGFAVVAEEVGNLAQMSGKASLDIAQMLSASQDQVKSIADKTTQHINQIVSQGRTKVERGNLVASECLTELEKISESIDALDASVREISEAIKEQSIGVNEVNTALKTLDQAMGDSNQMSERAKKTAEGLNQQAHALRASIQDLRKIVGSQKNYAAPPLEAFTEKAELF